MKSASVIAIGLALSAAPAMAQATETLPRFEALEQQQLTLQQDQLDSLARQQQAERNQSLSPKSGVTSAEQAVRELDYQREFDRLRLDQDQQRALVARERQIADAALLNRTIDPSSSTIVTDPQRYILPTAPAGTYYARVDGRFVLVDKTSKLVVQVLPDQPTDPINDKPAGPLPPNQPPLPNNARLRSFDPALATISPLAVGARIGPDRLSTGQAGASLPVPAAEPTPPRQPPLPTEIIAPDSTYAIREPLKLNLGPAPSGTYYAKIDNRIFLVDAKTQRAVALIRNDAG